MPRVISSVFFLIVSLLFLTHSNERNTDGDTLSAGIAHEFYYAGHKDDGKITDGSSNKNKTFTFCRFGKGQSGVHIFKEKQFANTTNKVRPLLWASACIYNSPLFQAYVTHIPDRLKDLLYPKHSFW